MFCIAAFIIFAILSIFSATYRPLVAKAWHCVLRRVTFRPCDISFSEEMKGRLLAKLIFTHPYIAKFLDRWIDWISFAFVLLSLWSVWYVAMAGLNLWVYDTCDPSKAESCSLSGEACGIDQSSLSIMEAIRTRRMTQWMMQPITQGRETLSRIPDRLKTWDATKYLASSATFFHSFDTTKGTALEIIDPSCKFCKKLTNNLHKAGTFEKQNISYILYPIPTEESGDTKFPHSRLMASYIEATKNIPLTHGDRSIPPDWQLLDKIFAESMNDSDDLQQKFVMGFTKREAEEALQKLLAEIGYTRAEREKIAQLASSQEVKEKLAEQKRIVEKDIRTIKIPTLLIGGRRYDRVIDVQKIQKIQ